MKYIPNHEKKGNTTVSLNLLFACHVGLKGEKVGIIARKKG